jgi:hypothetical protein
VFVTEEVMAMKAVVMAVGMALGAAAYAAPAQEPVLNQSEVTLVGCIKKETVYRTQMGETSAGISQNEIVLTSAKAATGSTTPAGVYGSFTLTGRLEPQLVAEVGRPVEITGIIEDEATHDKTMARKVLRPLFVKVWQPAGGSCS